MQFWWNWAGKKTYINLFNRDQKSIMENTMFYYLDINNWRYFIINIALQGE